LRFPFILNKFYFISAIVFFLPLLLPYLAISQTDTSKEHQVKVAYLVNFLSYSEWPAESILGSSEVIICTAGEDPVTSMIKQVEGKRVRGKKLSIRRVAMDDGASGLDTCHILFISPSVENKIEAILSAVEHQPVLTVSQVPGFLEKGGMINFVLHKRKVRFEVNRRAATREGLKFRAGLLGLATRLIQDEHENAL